MPGSHWSWSLSKILCFVKGSKNTLEMVECQWPAVTRNEIIREMENILDNPRRLNLLREQFKESRIHFFHPEQWFFSKLLTKKGKDRLVFLLSDPVALIWIAS